MSTKLAIACGALGVLIGVGATWLLTRPGEAGAPRDGGWAERGSRREPGERAVPIRIGTQAGTGANADEIRTLVAEEVRAALREQASSAPAGRDVPAAAADKAPAEPTPAFEQAKGQVAERITRGSWTAADRDWMRGALGAVNDAERMELTRQVILAANSGALRVELVGPLF
jgi:hypothetical protein